MKKNFKCRKCGCKSFRRGVNWEMKNKKTIRKRFKWPSKKLSNSVVCLKCKTRQRI